MSKLILSYKNSEIISELNSKGFETYRSDIVDRFLKPEQDHADMQLLRIKNDVFVLQECYDYYYELLNSNGLNIVKCSKRVGERYPENILLNFLFLDNALYGNLKYAEPKLIEYCNYNGISMINVKQGYTRCSTAIVSENAVITADSGICRALRNKGIDVLKISSGSIVLEGFDYGFIGGASFVIDDNIFFFGNIKDHPDYHKIEKFCIIHNKNIVIISSDTPLTDVGGAVIIN